MPPVSSASKFIESLPLRPINLRLLMHTSTFDLFSKVVPYTFVRRAVPVREGTYPEPSAFLTR